MTAEIIAALTTSVVAIIGAVTAAIVAIHGHTATSQAIIAANTPKPVTPLTASVQGVPEIMRGSNPQYGTQYTTPQRMVS
jgi:hypothetical protein